MNEGYENTGRALKIATAFCRSGPKNVQVSES